jgi:lactoylglutathione lyase
MLLIKIYKINSRRKAMELCCTYIETNKFEEVVSFYEKILQIKPNVYTKDRWIEFESGNKLSIYNKKFDEEKINNDNNVYYNEAYIRDFNKEQEKKVNNIITLNFYTEDLNQEYERIKKLHVGDVSEIMYVNITEPYYYFTVKDPEGNVLEICGDNYAEK